MSLPQHYARPAKAILRIIAFVAGTIAAARVAGYAFSIVLQQLANPDALGNYTDSFALSAATVACLAVFTLSILLLTGILYGRRPGGRLLLVFGGYLGACLGAAFTLAAILLAVPAIDGRHTTTPTKIVLPATLYAGVLIGVFTLLPALTFITVAERIKIRAAVIYAMAGVAAAILAYILYLAFLFRAELSVGTVLAGLLFFGLPGLVGGLVYWVIAGRSAGQRAGVHAGGI